MNILNKILVLLNDLGLYYRYRGIKPLTTERKAGDFKFGSLLNIWGYTPISQEKIIPTLSVKDQKQLANCSFQAATCQKEIDEGVVLSARDLTTSAYRKGWCKWLGYADLKAAQEILVKIGIDEEKYVNENTNLDFGSYTGISQNTLRQKAHKTKSYWRLSNVDEGLKAIDDGHAVVIGIDWFSGFNQGGGFSFPWLISKIIGYIVGGHALLWKGYKMNYQGRKVAIIQNSYSKLWGDGGDLYIDLDFLEAYIKKYGAYCNLDLEYNKLITTQDIIEKYDGHNIRGDKDGSIYLIYDGKKCLYVSNEAFTSINGFPYQQSGAFIIVPQASIDAVPYFNTDRASSKLNGDGGDWLDMASILKKPIDQNFNTNIPVDSQPNNKPYQIT